MARAALEQVPPLTEVRIRMPSQPPAPVDLTPFGMANTEEVFLPSEAPRGVIEAVVRRDDLG
jgi:urate oxidase